MSLFSAILHPNIGLGFMTLGASLHDILTKLKAEPQKFTKLDVSYSQEDPVAEPIILELPANGIRLRFDGPEQRLRLIEILDFTKNRITYQDKDIAKAPNNQGASSSPRAAGQAASGPAFKNVYHRLFGPTYAGEYINTDSKNGLYILSYPGVAFSFPVPKSAYSPDKDVVSLLSAPASQTAVSVAIFYGKSWKHAREHMWTEILPSIKSTILYSKSKEIVPDEISLVKIHGGGRLQLFKKWTNSHFWLNLGETSPQDLVAELGAPDAIYRKNDQRMYIHKDRTASDSRSGSSSADQRRPDDLTDTDQSSVPTGSDESDDEAIEEETVGNVSGECFYNYFYLGFDILISPPKQPSRIPPSQMNLEEHQLPGASIIKNSSPDRLVATKVILHANVPGSYPFNRHRRVRWEVAYLSKDANDDDDGDVVDSEMHFDEIEKRLREEWKSIFGSKDDAQKRQRGMVLNRGWGDSPGSSIEFLGGWEDSSGGLSAKKLDDSGDSTTTLYGFPGLVFEVLKNGYVSAVTLW
ncbi:hypothetical protein F4808DRAFT_450565 [Astrocystis sublimbata]|nr:hypothetical protein F4808DRAFT_450565 [Astrocystis sublimbata]